MKEQLVIRVEPQMKRRLERLAAEHKRPVSQEAILLLEIAMREVEQAEAQTDGAS